MRFERHGRAYQLAIARAEDLPAVLAIDDAHWVANSAPCGAFRCDPRFLALIDGDNDGRITTHDLRQAIRLALDAIDDIHELDRGDGSLRLAALRDNEQGRTLRATATRVLAALLAPDGAQVTLAQVRQYRETLQGRAIHGDGAVVPAAAQSDSLRIFLVDAARCTGGGPDAGAGTGVTAAQLQRFRTDIEAALAWLQAGEAALAQADEALLPLGAETEAAYRVWEAMAPQVDRYFAHCRLQAFAAAGGCAPLPLPAATDAPPDVYLAEQLPAVATAAGTLPLDDGTVNPVYAAGLHSLRVQVVQPLLRRTVTHLAAEDWQRLRERLSAYAAYAARRPGEALLALGRARLSVYLEGELFRDAFELVNQDRRVAAEVALLVDLERLLCCQQNLLRFANNFVALGDLYAPSRRALFEMGSAVIDGRWFNLALRVDDRKAHEACARDSNIFTLYLDVADARGATLYQVAVPVTSGARGNLGVGKHGVFTDVDGVQHPATVRLIVENPVSLGEALCAPFSRLWSFILGKIDTIAATGEKSLTQQADTLMGGAPVPAGTSPAPAPAGKPGLPAGAGGLLMSLSVSAAAIGTAVAFMAKTFSGLSHAQRMAGLAGALCALGVPVALSALLKLRRQDLGALLEGCGWGINARLRLTRAQRRQFTTRPPYPAEATGLPRRVGWMRVLILLAVASLLVLAGLHCAGS